MKEAVLRKKEGHKAMCQNSTEENKSIKNKVNKAVYKAVSKAIREKAEEALIEFKK